MSTLKFPALPIGQRFRLNGTVFIKTSPVLARAQDSGQTQMIARSAIIEALDAGTPAAVAPPGARSVLDDFHNAALNCLDELARAASVPAAALKKARLQLDKAHRQARAQLDADG